MKNALSILVLFLGTSSAMAQDAVQEIIRPAKVMTVTESSQVLQRRYPAIVQPSMEAELSFRVSGQVINLPVRAFANVVKGDVIAELDKRTFESTLIQLESQRDQAKAQLDALKAGARAEEIAALEASVAAAQAQLDQAQEQVERSRELSARGVIASAVLDDDEADARVAAANLQAAQEQLAIGRAGGRAEDVAAAEAALRGLDSQIKEARDNLDDTTLRAPFDGLIARRDIDNFINVQAGQPIVLMQSLDVVDLAFDVPGPDVVIWGANDDVVAQVELDALPGQVLDAELVEFIAQADAGTHTYRTRVAVDVPDDQLILAGMVGNVVVSSAKAAAPGIAIPITAVGAASDGSSFVWVVDPATNAVKAQPVSLGDMSGHVVQLTEGLENGMTIVTAGVSFLREGTVIRPISKVGE